MASRKAALALRNRPDRLSLLLIVIVLAVALTLAVSGGAAARSTFQSTPLQVDTATPTQVVEVTIITDTPTPFDPMAVTATPTPFGLPPPTETPDPAFAQPEPPPAALPTAEPEAGAPAPGAPAPGAPAPGAPAPGGPGFLPAPTLTNPNDFLPGSGSLAQPAPAPLTGPAVAVEEDAAAAESAPPSDATNAAQLIDSGIRALSYLWLCCGAILILVAVLVFVWLMHRTRR
jgi:hypothetical protein